MGTRTFTWTHVYPDTCLPRQKAPDTCYLNTFHLDKWGWNGRPRIIFFPFCPCTKFYIDQDNSPLLTKGSLQKKKLKILVYYQYLVKSEYNFLPYYDPNPSFAIEWWQLRKLHNRTLFGTLLIIVWLTVSYRIYFILFHFSFSRQMSSN